MAASPQELVIVSFTLNRELFGIDIHQIREVLNLCEIIKVPDTPPIVEGIINLRGSVVCVLDLHKRFQVDKPPPTSSSRIIIVDSGERVMGLIVDKVHEVLRLPPDQVEPVPPEMTTVDTRYLQGVGKVADRFMLIIDVGKMLKTEELLRLAE